MKLLMLHGYTQNGNNFQRKLRKLEQRLHTIFPGSEFVWPEGPLQLCASGVPGYDLASNEKQYLEGPELRAWFHLQNMQVNPPQGLLQSIDMLAEVLERDGPFDGVIAFSQGTVLAAILASLLQGKSRHEAFQEHLQTSRDIMPYPEAFKDIQHPPFKFGILYAGRVFEPTYFNWLYNPPIETSFCHFVGKWDPMVAPEERDLVLTKLSSGPDSRTITHCGGHFVPVDDLNTDHVVDFLAECSSRTSSESSGSCRGSVVSGIDSGIGFGSSSGSSEDGCC